MFMAYQIAFYETDRGNTLSANYIKHIEKGIGELRPEFAGVEFRFFYFVVVEHQIIIVHAIK